MDPSSLLCTAKYLTLSRDVPSGSDIMPCNKINNPLVVSLGFTDLVRLHIMTSIITLCKICQIFTFKRSKCDFYIFFNVM